MICCDCDKDCDKPLRDMLLRYNIGMMSALMSALHFCQPHTRGATLRFSWSAAQAADTGDLDVVRSVLSLVPKDLDEATGRALSTCNYANVLGKAFG